MAYCVHCGVKLGNSEKRCPLCQTVVLDPAEPRNPSAPRSYPVRTPEQELKRNKRYLLLLSALILLFPAALCLIIDLLTSGQLQTWSIYASGALILLFIAVAVPLTVPRHRVYWSVAAVFLCLNGYLFLVERLSDSGIWFFPIALPALALGTALLITLILLYRHQRLNKLTLLAAGFAAVAVECGGVEIFRSLARTGSVSFVWSPYVWAPCLFISLALFLINGNRAAREEVRRRVHF